MLSLGVRFGFPRERRSFGLWLCTFAASTRGSRGGCGDVRAVRFVYGLTNSCLDQRQPPRGKEYKFKLLMNVNFGSGSMCNNWAFSPFAVFRLPFRRSGRGP